MWAVMIIKEMIKGEKVRQIPLKYSTRLYGLSVTILHFNSLARFCFIFIFAASAVIHSDGGPVGLAAEADRTAAAHTLRQVVPAGLRGTTCWSSDGAQFL